MGNLHLVTGHAGKAHVMAADHGSLHAALFGEGEYVLDRGNQFANTVISNNQVRITDGDLLMQGRHIRLNEGSYVDLTVENGTQGMVRHDLVVARYTKDSLTGVEDCNLVVIKGTANASTATDPDYTVGSIIHDNALLAEMPLYRIEIENLTIVQLVPLFTVLPTVDEQYKTLTDKVETAIDTMTLKFSNKTVSSWASDSTYDGFSYRGQIACSGVTSTMIADVVFSAANATSGNFAPVCQTYNGGVYIYAVDKPTDTVTIPTIICWR